MNVPTLLRPGSVVAHVENALDAIARLDGRLRAMITTTADAARERAQALDALAARGERAGLLHGLTVTLKDVIQTAGVRTTNGANFPDEEHYAEDAEVVARLARAGAVIIGKANLHEFAYGGTTQNPFHGSCRNPWDTERIPGGSSGGSGAGVAAGFAHASLGTDTAGSGRLPAALNGIAGLRPTPGRISLRGVTPVSAAFDTISPMARRVSDLAQLFAVLAGYDPADPVSVDRPVEDALTPMTAGVAGLRLGLPRRWFFEGMDGGVASAIEAGLAALERAGAKLVEVEVPSAESASAPFEQLFHTDGAGYHEERLARAPDRYGADTRERLTTLGGKVSGPVYARALVWAAAWRRRLQGVFAEVDALVHPSAPAVAPTVAECRNTTATTRRLTTYCYPWSLACVPVLSMPAGFAEHGMPCGLSVVARWWNEPMLFRVGAAYQRLTDWHLCEPPIVHDGKERAA
jgi:aspartyl-tRNA(Asn)/glutamyl-tRNA(Gln) amidotransferase subunit A